MQVEKVFFHVPYKNLMKNLDFISKHAIDCEIFFDADALDICSEKDIDLINSTLNDHGLSRTIHAPFMDLNLGSFDSRIRETTYKRFEQTLALCKSLDARSAIFHSMFFPLYYESTLKRWLQYAKEGWQPLLTMAKKCGVTIIIENSVDTSPKAILALLKEINDESFKACLDFGHYYIFGEKTGLEYLKEYPKGSIKEIHLSDNNTKSDQHLGLGKGSLPFTDFFRALDELSISPIVTVETHTLEDILVSRTYLKSQGVLT
ncbi:MAG: sugar phosphate isomerase/epimerase family protein [Candidatus Omnitrophota bacterium]